MEDEPFQKGGGEVGGGGGGETPRDNPIATTRWDVQEARK